MNALADWKRESKIERFFGQKNRILGIFDKLILMGVVSDVFPDEAKMPEKKKFTTNDSFRKIKINRRDGQVGLCFESSVSQKCIRSSYFSFSLSPSHHLFPLSSSTLHHFNRLVMFFIFSSASGSLLAFFFFF